MTARTPFLGLALAALALAGPAARGADEPGTIKLTNDTQSVVRIDADYLIDADGKKVELNRYWLLKPNQYVAAPDGQLYTGTAFYFRLTTTDGQTAGWSVSAERKNLNGWVKEEALTEHRRLLAKRRADKVPGPYTLAVRVPPGTAVSANGGAVLEADGLALVVVPPRKDWSETQVVAVTLSLTADGRTHREERAVRLAHTGPGEWDCRDLAAPNKVARTARYLLEIKAAGESRAGRLPKDATAADRAKHLRLFAAELDDLPTRGVDEDAVKFAQASSESLRRLGTAVAAGGDTEAALKAFSDEIDTATRRLDKLMTARYGDALDRAVAGGGRLDGPEVTALKPPAPRPMAPQAAERRRQIESELIDVERDIERGRELVARWDREVQSWDDKLREANEAMKRARTNDERFLVGFAQGYALGQKIDAERSKRQAEAALGQSRDRLAQLRKELVGLRD